MNARIIINALILVLVLSILGCGSTRFSWHHPVKGKAEFRNDRQSCLPEKSMGDLDREWRRMDYEEYQLHMDNIDAFEGCMKSKGWTKGKK